jgi:RNA polymerase sigma-70 factor, ECF subfamily
MGHLLHAGANDGVGVQPLVSLIAGALSPADAPRPIEEPPLFSKAPRSAPVPAGASDDDSAPASPAPLSPQAIADSALVRRVQAGDMAAFEEIFHKYKGVIYRTALAITRDPGVAEEVLQDCFYKTYTSINRIQPDMAISPWLHRVAVNLSCNAIKRRRGWLEPIENIAERLFTDPHHSPEHLCEQSELQGAIRDIVNDLPLKHRVVVVMHYLQELSLPEIAAILDCPVGTVKSRLHYARKVLRLEIEARYLEGRPAPVPAPQPQKA